MTTAIAIGTEWTAKQHGGVLSVSGEVTMPTPGYTVTLKKAVPQGINPAILLLEKVIVAPKHREPDHVVVVHVSFAEHTLHLYKEVSILPDGPVVTINSSR